MLDAQSAPLRNYLVQHVMPTLTVALIDVCKVRPEDPIDYLVYLEGFFSGSNSLVGGVPIQEQRQELGRFRPVDLAGSRIRKLLFNIISISFASCEIERERASTLPLGLFHFFLHPQLAE